MKAESKRGLERLASMFLASGFAPPLLAQWQAISLQPEGYTTSQVHAVTASRQFGELNTPVFASSPATWSGSVATWSPFAEPGVSGSVLGVGGGQAVGWYEEGHAALWNEDGTGFVDLSQPSWWASHAVATDGDEQVGYYYPNGGAPTRAVLWRGAASSLIELQPSGGYDSQALAASSGLQGGWLRFTASANVTAALWSGSAQSYLSLNPAGSLESQIRGMAPGQQVGFARFPAQGMHAGMWFGSAASYMDMGPPGSGVSELLATCGSAQVGWANIGGDIGAGIWFGTPESFISLGAFVPPGYSQSVATSVAFDGTRYYVGGYALQDISGEPAAFLWVGVPAPGSLLPLAAAVQFLRRRRRCHDSNRAPAPPACHHRISAPAAHTPRRRTRLQSPSRPGRPRSSRDSRPPATRRSSTRW